MMLRRVLYRNVLCEFTLHFLGLLEVYNLLLESPVSPRPQSPRWRQSSGPALLLVKLDGCFWLGWILLIYRGRRSFGSGFFPICGF